MFELGFFQEFRPPFQLVTRPRFQANHIPTGKPASLLQNTLSDDDDDDDDGDDGDDHDHDHVV